MDCFVDLFTQKCSQTIRMFENKSKLFRGGVPKKKFQSQTIHAVEMNNQSVQKMLTHKFSKKNFLNVSKTF